VEVAVAAQDDSTCTVRFSVRDTGVGIPKEKQGRLFQPFSQADSSTTRKYGGTGLGLAICSRLVQLMHGEIGLESNPGAGAIFWFAIPLEKMPALAQPAREAESTTTGKSVHFICPNDMWNERMCALAKSWGINASSSHSPAQAQALLNNGQLHADALVVNFPAALPAASALLRELRSARWGAGTRLIIIAPLGHELELHHLGTRETVCLHKPLRRHELQTAITRSVSPVETPAAASSAVLDGSGQERAGWRVLLVDSNPVRKVMVHDLAARRGFNVISVDSPTEAARRVERDGPAHFQALILSASQPGDQESSNARASLRALVEANASGAVILEVSRAGVVVNKPPATASQAFNDLKKLLDGIWKSESQMG